MMDELGAARVFWDNKSPVYYRIVFPSGLEVLVKEIAIVNPARDPEEVRDYDPNRDADQPGDQGEADAADDARYVYADDHQRPPRGDY